MDESASAYVICSSPRSGTTLLCDLLTETRVAGRPDSFFRGESREWWAEYFNVSTSGCESLLDFDQAYLNAVVEEGRHETPVFGMRVMWESLGDLLYRLGHFFPDETSDRARLEQAFGSLTYIHLSRYDKIAQAVSHLRAEQSGLWHRHADGTERERMKPTEETVYDAQRIAKLVAEAVSHDTAWEAWFEQHHISPVHIAYEDLSKEPRAVLARILAAIGQDPKIAISIEPKTSKLANAESLEWISRFRATGMKK